MISNRIIPKIPSKEQKIDLIIDSDVANEIDDLYALTIAFYYPEKFNIKGIIATHYAFGGPGGTEKSYELLKVLMQKAGRENAYTIKKGSHPMQYVNTPNDSEGVDFIIDTARNYSEDNPLWVVALGAATNLASAILKAPDIIPKVRFVFHARCSHCWPERSEQFNVYGDIIAAQTLLNHNVPLVWFDTGTDICASYETTEKNLLPLGQIGEWLHKYRDLNPYFRGADKGFFDMGDFAYLFDPTCCESEIVDVPEMTRFMYFNHNHNLGKMVRVYNVNVKFTWNLFYEGIKKHLSGLQDDI